MKAEDYIRKIKCLSGKESISKFNNAFSIDEVLRLMRGFAYKNTKKLHQHIDELFEENKELDKKCCEQTDMILYLEKKKNVKN